MNDKTTAQSLELLEILGINPHECVGDRARVDALAQHLRREGDTKPVVVEVGKGGGK